MKTRTLFLLRAAWYDLGAFRPSSGQAFWLGVPDRKKKSPALRALKITAIELSLE